APDPAQRRHQPAGHGHPGRVGAGRGRAERHRRAAVRPPERADGHHQVRNALPFKSALSPGHLKLATIGSTYYGVPYLADLSVLWYNKALFKKAGLDPNSPPTSYAEIVSDAQKISKLGHGIYGFSFAGNCQGCLGFTMLPSMWAAGQHMLNGPLGQQTANVANDAPLKTMLAAYQKMWSE